ncbi:S-layer homology domain-containing protein [Acidaminobacter hydrogenoformans]|uniref:Lysophospholipase L1 n=1 Tax=Acidaminobacter hydrogenoformans DSM 2784 TaxID=1120920 RepID=A0A1G5RQB0_9FIRM|nr:S-layer homology domain-containing protein [Acidaminobacter hydrogenoformans]SCZ76058.1 Lysophospholipase L1 [Acidaminobacter hydrogenoformans DSM 2784]
MQQIRIFLIQKISLVYFVLAFIFIYLIFSQLLTWTKQGYDSQMLLGSSTSSNQSTVNYTGLDYVALGDSYSAGQTPYGVAVGYSYTDMINEKIRERGYAGNYDKMGVSGYTTINVFNQLYGIEQMIAEAEIVTIDIGINDLLLLPEVYAYLFENHTKSFDVAEAAAIQQIPEAAANLKKIIVRLKDISSYADPQIYVMGYFNAFPEFPEFLPVIQQLNEAIRLVTEDTGVRYIETMPAMDAHLWEYLPGDLHPTVEGYRAIAEAFWREIEKSLFNSLTSPHLIKPSDISEHWAEEKILRLYSQGIIAGYEDGTFKPNHPMTRAEFVTLMNKFFKYTELGEIGFSDVPESAWYITEVQKAVKAGYISGYIDNTFQAKNPVTRQEAAVIIAKIMGYDLSDGLDVTSRFVDGAEIPNWSRKSLNALIKRGIIGGYPDRTLKFQGTVTRAEVVSILSLLTTEQRAGE